MTQPQSPWTSQRSDRTSRREWIKRFGIFFLGVAIGLGILGLQQMGRQKALQQKAATTSGQPLPQTNPTTLAPAKPDPTPKPTP